MKFTKPFENLIANSFLLYEVFEKGSLGFTLEVCLPIASIIPQMLDDV